jgi:hypothetical protein
MSTPIAVAVPADLLDTLKAFECDLAEWLLYASPVTDEDRERVRQVRALRTELDHEINRIVAVRMKLATADLKAHAARLSLVTVQLQATASSLGTPRDILHAAGEVVSIAHDIVVAIAG